MTVSFPQLLDAAESRMQTDESCSDLIQSLCKQLALETQAEAVALIAWDGANRIPVLQLGQQLNDEYELETVPPGRILRKKISTDKRLLQTAARVSGGMTIVLMSAHSSDVNSDELHAAVIEVIADLYRRRLLEAASSKDAAHREQLNLLSCLHQSLDADTVANTIATDGVVLTAARSISVANRIGKRWTVVAATGVSHPNDRSDAIRNTLAAIKDATQLKAEEAPETSMRQPVVVRPLNVPADFQSARWAAVFDFSDGLGNDQAVQRVGVDLLCHHGALALANCERYASSSVSNQLKHFGRRLVKPGSLFSIVLAVAAIACLFLLKTELRIESYGELVPVDRIFVFAPEDGTIEQVNVNDGSDVTMADTLCVLSNEDIQVQLEGLEGSLAETAARLAAISALKGRQSASPERGLLSAEQLELEARSKSLKLQIQIMERRMAALTLTSTTNGRVYGDRLSELLTNRPVQRGQFLFEVANPNGEWQLELKVPELDIRHVLHVVQKNNADLPTVRYALETSPEITHQARLKSIAGSTEIHSDGKLTTLVVVDVGEEQYSTQRPGTGVVAYIDCGRHRVGYVWFRKIIEFVQRNTWL